MGSRQETVGSRQEAVGSWQEAVGSAEELQLLTIRVVSCYYPTVHRVSDCMP